MKKIWKIPEIIKIEIKKITLNGSGSSVENKPNQGAASKRPYA